MSVHRQSAETFSSFYVTSLYNQFENSIPAAGKDNNLYQTAEKTPTVTTVTPNYE